MKIKIVTPRGELRAEVNETKNPKTAKAVIAALPMTGEANRWGDEIYFEIPVDAVEENTQQDVGVGDVAYWPPGRALCIFFGRTPVSKGEKPRAYSPVNVFGRMTAPANFASILKQVKDGEEIRIERA